MAKEKFSWKGLFIRDDDAAREPETVADRTTVSAPKATFPDSNASNNEAIPNETLSRVIEMYEKGFDSLNKPGYDFYEFFKAVMATDPNNSQSYVMAYTMANTMDKTFTKTALLSSGEFYIAEVLKVYSKYDDEGKKVKDRLIKEQKDEKEKLQSEVKSIQNKIITLQAELEQKTNLLLNYDNNNSGKVREIEQKIIANNLAKDRIIQRISQVISGINNHI